MSSTTTAPDADDATLFEFDRVLVSAGNDAAQALQQAKDQNITIYPFIEFAPLKVRQADHVGPSPEQSDVLQSLYSSALDECKRLWDENRSKVEQTFLFRIGKTIYDFADEKFAVKSEPPAEHPLFNRKTSNIICVAWHPHKDLVAIAYGDDKVYVFEKERNAWSCDVLEHCSMTNVTCLEWKAKAGGILAVGCHEGVCVWNLYNEDERPSSHFATGAKQPSVSGNNAPTGKRNTTRFHGNAWMNPLYYPGHTHISSLAWDPSPGSHALVAASAVSSTLVVYDTLTLQSMSIKRYGKGNIMVRWSPNGEWLYVTSMSGLSRMWETHNWTSTQFINPPGLWVQAACWAPDSRSLFYSMHRKSDVHVLYRYGSTMSTGVWDIKVLSAPPTEVTTRNDQPVPVGGAIRDISLDPTNGRRLAVAYENSELLALYEVKPISLLISHENISQCISFIGYARGSRTEMINGNTCTKAQAGTKPLHVAYARSFPRGALLATVWDNNTISFLTQRFITDEEQQKKY